MFLLHLLFLTFATASLSSLSAKWCNDYFCLDASSSLAEITYALTARVDDLGWIAVGTGYTMDGSKMFLLYPAPDGTCVLSERDGHGYKPPVITPQPISRLLPSPANTTHLTCRFSLPASALPIPPNNTTATGMLWGYSSTPPNTTSSVASIKRHDAFGIFDLAFKDVQDTDHEPRAEEVRRKRMMRAHAVFMTLAWAVTAPIAVLFARFGRGTFAQWVKCHQWIQIGLTTSFTLVGFSLAVAAIRVREGKHFTGPHENFGLLLVLLLLFQIASGLFIHKLYNPLRTHRPPRNFLHMIVGCLLLIGGLVEVKLGIGKWGSEKWMVVTFYVWTGLLVVTFTVGLSLLPRQLRTEKNTAKQRAPDVRLSRIQASFPAHRFDRQKDKSSPHPSAGSPSPSSAELGSSTKLHIQYPWHKPGHTLSPSSPLSAGDNAFSIPPPNAGGGYRDRPSPLGTSPTRNLTSGRRHEGTVDKDDIADAQREVLRRKI
ncbi:hypothetical protein NCC49_003206 [Naganishia albida]|nr:hypothetical protein NCC49_003206 [Naganishia albida]